MRYIPFSLIEMTEANNAMTGRLHIPHREPRCQRCSIRRTHIPGSGYHSFLEVHTLPSSIKPLATLRSANKIDTNENSPVYGVIFLFKWLRETTSPSTPTTPQDGTYTTTPPDNLFFAAQTIQNACGTQAILSIILNQDTPATHNNNQPINIGPELQSFKDFTTGFPSDLRGEALSNSHSNLPTPAIKMTITIATLIAQYNQQVPAPQLPLPSGSTLLHPSTQSTIYECMFNEDNPQAWPLPPVGYRMRVLKMILGRLEEAIVNPEEDVRPSLCFWFDLRM